MVRSTVVGVLFRKIIRMFALLVSGFFTNYIFFLLLADNLLQFIRVHGKTSTFFISRGDYAPLTLCSVFFLLVILVLSDTKNP
jgi:hypothetical protein